MNNSCDQDLSYKKSFCSVAEADLFFEDRLDFDLWNNHTNETKKRALITASEKLSDLDWVGFREIKTSLLAFPRYMTINGCQSYFDRPIFLISATCEYALFLIDNFKKISEKNNIKSVSFSGMRMDFKENEFENYHDIPMPVYLKIEKYLHKSKRLYRC